MTEPQFSIVPLNDHDRSGFSCGVEPLNAYFQKQANQDMKRRVAACFVAVEKATGLVAGYYTLSACHVYLDALDEDWRRKLPRYPTVPAVRLGRLAIDARFQGRKLGSALLANAVARTVRSEIAATIIVVEAKDETAAAFYQYHGFRRNPEQPLRLLAPLALISVSLGLP